MRRDRSGRLLGAAPEPISASEAAEVARAAGDAGHSARLLARRVDAQLSTVGSLSPLTSELTVAYVERVAQPMSAMSLPAGARLVARGYLAHVLLERNPADFDIDDIPVLGTLPPLKRGRAPQDILTRIVKITRRHFASVCALSPEAWEAFVVASTAAVHSEARPASNGGASGNSEGDDVDEGAGVLSLELVDGMLRTGWILRQVDLAYDLQPDIRGPQA